MQKLAILLLFGFGPAAIFGSMFDSVNQFLLVALPLAFLVTWWVMSVRLIIRSAASKARVHAVQGSMIHTSQRTWRTADYEDTYELHYLALDDGTREVVEGWEVPLHVHNLFPHGTRAEAVVSGDRRYPYSIAHI